jgi:ectoine hydroxylase-related dioxygenase (phytanoyl-CoA dioxygenase family)
MYETILSPEELARYDAEGYLYPIRVMSADEAADLRSAVEEHLSGRITSECYELTDPVVIRPRDGGKGLEYDESANSPDPTELPFLFNLWKTDERFRSVGLDRRITDVARQLLRANDILLFEDNVVTKTAGYGTLSWHQDYSYWPLAEPTAITVWIALEDTDINNGGLEVVPGSHRSEERLPVWFKDSTALMEDLRPGVRPMPQDPAADGMSVVHYSVRAGECGVHHPLLWHASAPNASALPRHAFILRYVPVGTIWLGDERMPYEDIDCESGSPLGPTHFPLVPA